VDLVAKTFSMTNSFVPPPELVTPPAILYDKRLRKMRGEDFWYFSKGLIYETNSPEVERIYRDFEKIEAMTPR
jgi:hypothetical protein